jgi:hypothetical protein
VGFYVVQGEQLDWEPYERYRRRHRAAVTEVAALRHTRANFIRHEPGEKGPRQYRARAGRQQIVNETDEEILVFIYGAPPQRGPADVIKSAV